MSDPESNHVDIFQVLSKEFEYFSKTAEETLHFKNLCDTDTVSIQHFIRKTRAYPKHWFQQLKRTTKAVKEGVRRVQRARELLQGVVGQG